jgi:hypothetical protein
MVTKMSRLYFASSFAEEILRKIDMQRHIIVCEIFTDKTNFLVLPTKVKAMESIFTQGFFELLPNMNSSIALLNAPGSGESISTSHFFPLKVSKAR